MNDKASARVFLAVGITPSVAAAVARLSDAIGRRAPSDLCRFVDAAQAHVTLRFLGQRSGDEQDLIVKAASAAATGTPPFGLAFGPLGVFPDERRPHTLWIGLTEGRAEMVSLARRLENELAQLGFAPEERPYAPHLTIARIKRRPPAGLMKDILASSVPAMTIPSVESFVMMESRPAGPSVRYVPLRTFRLESPCTPSK